MMHDPWFWAFVASYICGGIMLCVWITNGGDQYTRTPRWRLILVAAIWPFPMLAGIGEFFLNYFLNPKSD